MASVIDGVDSRTQLVGQNRLELLLFRLGGKQRFGINVFKVREVVRCPKLTRLPNLDSQVRGIAHMRGNTVFIVDLGMTIGQKPVDRVEDAFVVLTEFNRSVQGFLVGSVDRIINMNWEEVLPPPKATGSRNYMTAVTNVDGELVEIIDVEQILEEITGSIKNVSQELLTDIHANTSGGDIPKRVLIADDSGVARRQVAETLDQMGLDHVTARDGREALDILREWEQDGGPPVSERIGMVISDIEMPEMDGYTLTKEIKSDPQLAGLYVLLHTSLSGVFNDNMVKKVGADQFVPKFNADELATAVGKRFSCAVPGDKGHNEAPKVA